MTPFGWYITASDKGFQPWSGTFTTNPAMATNLGLIGYTVTALFTEEQCHTMKPCISGNSGRNLNQSSSVDAD